jgi:hypothetical protein
MQCPFCGAYYDIVDGELKPQVSETILPTMDDLDDGI